jgi:hypothetical protein
MTQTLRDHRAVPKEPSVQIFGRHCWQVGGGVHEVDAHEDSELDASAPELVQ